MNYACRHLRGGGACGEIAFYVDEIPSPGYALKADSATLPNGKKPIAGQIIVCGACGKPMGMPASEDVEIINEGDL